MLELSFLEVNKLFFQVSIGEQLLRLLAATLVGAIFGFEREMKGKPAGFVTFMIVSMGACIIALLQINTIDMIYEAIINNPGNDYLPNILNADLTRVIAQVVSGVGFLGAGTILYSKGSIKGITTAAMLWVAAGLGLLIGIGGTANYIVALTTAVLFIPIMFIMRIFGRKITEKYRSHRIFLVFDETYEKDLYDDFAQHGAVIKKTFFHNKYQKDGKMYKEIFLYFNPGKKLSYEVIINDISDKSWVISVEEA